MIQSDKGYIKVAGDNIDIMFEFNTIVKTILKVSPEIYIASVEAWADDVMDMLHGVDSADLKFATIISKRTVSELKKENK